MPNNNGNTRRCRSCGKLAGKDGFCKNHRPIDTSMKRHIQRGNYVDSHAIAGHKGFNGEFAIIKDKFGIEER